MDDKYYPQVYAYGQVFRLATKDHPVPMIQRAMMDPFKWVPYELTRAMQRRNLRESDHNKIAELLSCVDVNDVLAMQGQVLPMSLQGVFMQGYYALDDKSQNQ